MQMVHLLGLQTHITADYKYACLIMVDNFMGLIGSQ